MNYGLPLNGDGDDKCLSMLNAVEETTSRQLRACKAPPSKRRVLEGRYLPVQFITISPLFLFFVFLSRYQLRFYIVLPTLL